MGKSGDALILGSRYFFGSQFSVWTSLFARLAWLARPRCVDVLFALALVCVSVEVEVRYHRCASLSGVRSLFFGGEQRRNFFQPKE